MLVVPYFEGGGDSWKGGRLFEDWVGLEAS